MCADGIKTLESAGKSGVFCQFLFVGGNKVAVRGPPSKTARQRGRDRAGRLGS